MIMKKNYFKPETVMVDLVLCNIIATSGNTNVGGGNAGSGFPNESKGSRGEWGNVWGN